MQLPKLKLHEFVSPAGAGIMLICFFLPWLRVSCGGKSVTLSGPGLGGVFWAILGISIMMLAAYIILGKRKKLHLSRWGFIAGSIVSIIIIAYESIKVAVDPEIPFYIPSGMIGFKLKPGSWGMLLGLALTLVGAYFLKTATPKDDGKD